MELAMNSATTTMAVETEDAEDLLVLAESPGIIPFFPSIMALQPDSAEFNTSQCICSDLQHEDYSPLYAWFNYIVIIIMLPSLSAFGVVTNLVNVFVYSRPRMRNSSNTYLLFLACSDFFVVLTGLFIFWIDSARSYIPQLVQAPYTTVYTLPFGYMAQSCSIYFTVAAAFDCYVCVCWRRKSKQHCTVSRARRIVGAIALLSVVYNSLRFPQFNLRKCIHDGSGEMIVEICPTSLFFRINTAYNVYLYMIVMTLFPFSVLLLLNLLIVCRKSIDANRHRQQQKKKSTSSIASSIPTTTANGSLVGSKHSNKEIVQQASIGGSSFNAQSKSHIAAALLAGPHAQFPSLPKAVNSGSDETITMIMVVVLFLCCNTLALVVNLIETFFEPDALLLNLLSDASNFLVIFNSSVNCVIYLIFNSEYREVFFSHFVHFKGRCYPFHLLQCLFECHCPNSQQGHQTHRHQSKSAGNGSIVVSASPSMGEGMATNTFCYSEKVLGRFRQRDSVTEGTPKSLMAGPESPIWLQYPCTALSSFPNSRSGNNHFCHHHRHHYCPCWANAKPNIGEWATISSANQQKGMAMFPADDFEEERDSGCGDENCSNSNTNQRHLHRNSSMSTSPMRGAAAHPHQGQQPLQNTNCYLAEVKMMIGGSAGDELLAMPSPPHIYVRPLLGTGSNSRNRIKEEWMMRMRNGGDRIINGNGGGFAGEEQFEFMDDEILMMDANNGGGGGDFPVTAL